MNTTQTTHTPGLEVLGPYCGTDMPDYYAIIERTNGGHFEVARVTDLMSRPGLATAKLMSAAPDLLAALEKAHDIVNSYAHIPALRKACEVMQSAIAKARVES